MRKSCRNGNSCHGECTPGCQSYLPLLSDAVLAGVRAQLLHDAIGLLMNHEQHEDENWIADYKELVKEYSEHFK